LHAKINIFCKKTCFSLVFRSVYTTFVIRNRKQEEMKKLLPLIVIAVLTGVVASCDSKKKQSVIIANKYEKPAPQGPIRTDDYKDSKSFKWLDREYVCTIERLADDSLPMVKDETDQLFVDNRVKLTISRADGSVFFNRTFTKATFNSYIDDDFRQTGILEGFVFDKVEGNEVRFACSVTRPQSDEYIPLLLAVTRNGDIAITRDTRMDTELEDDSETDDSGV